MQKKEYLIIPNKKELDLYTEYGFNTFILPLDGYSIGFNVYYSVEEVNKLSLKYNIYVIMNKFLHKEIEKFRKIYNDFNSNIKFIVEDIGLTDIIVKDRLVLYENHILSNYKAINFLESLNIKNVVINNDLTIDELIEIRNKTNSNLYYFYVGKNSLMYSRRNLVSNYNKYYNLDNTNNYKLTEKVSKKVLDIFEEKDGSVVYFDKIFCASKYIDKLDMNLIINFTNIDSVSEKIILEEYNKANLCDLIDSDYYFLENDIKYKVGDIK